MSWERQQRCRFYPKCLLHNGDPTPLKFTSEDIREMRDLYQLGDTIPDLALEFGTTERTVRQILRRQTYTEV